MGKPNDPVTNPVHYTQGKIECLDVIEDQNFGFLDGCALKYLWRYRFKHTPIQDLKKCRFYIDRIISNLEKEV